MLSNTTVSTPIESPRATQLSEFTTLELAQVLGERLAIPERKWHQLKGNRLVRSREQVIAALVFLLTEQPDEALPRLQQAMGWLDGSLSAPPCPTHGQRQSK